MPSLLALKKLGDLRDELLTCVLDGFIYLFRDLFDNNVGARALLHSLSDKEVETFSIYFLIVINRGVRAILPHG